MLTFKLFHLLISAESACSTGYHDSESSKVEQKMNVTGSAGGERIHHTLTRNLYSVKPTQLTQVEYINAAKWGI